MGDLNNIFNMSPETANNLTNFGFATMAAGAQPGATTLGALGQGGLGMNQAATQHAQQQYIQSEAQKNQLQNQLFPYQLQMAKINSAMAQQDFSDEYPNAGKPSTAMPNTSPTAGITPIMPSSSTRSVQTSPPVSQAQGADIVKSLFLPDENSNWNSAAPPVSDGRNSGQKLANNNIPATSQVQTGPTPQEQAQLDGLARKARLQKRIGGDSSPYEAQAQRINNTILARDKENLTYQKSAQGTYALPGQQTQPASSPLIPLTPEQSAKYISGDGKSIIPFVQGARYAPDPSGIPQYKTENTETGVNQTKLFQADDSKANAALTASASSLQNEKFRLKELADVYKQVRAGTLTAQNPELANKLIAWGVIKNPSDIKDVAGVQNAMQSHILQIIQQIKDTNANMGGAPTRTFGSEISNLMEQGENAGAQPEALWNIISQARGIVDHHLDIVKGWDDIGGLGNRLANGNTLRPDDYARKFIGQHDIADYKTAAQKEMGSFKGMSNPTNREKGTSLNRAITHRYIPGQGIVPVGGQ